MADIRALRRGFLVVTALRWLPVGLTFAISVIWMTTRGLSLAQVGVVLAIHGLTVAALELPTGGLADAVGRRPVLLASALLFVAATVTFLVADSFAVFALSWFIQGVGRALDSGPLDAWFVDEVLRRDPQHHLERDLAAASTVLSAGLAFGALLAAGVGWLAAEGWLAGVDPVGAPVALAALVGVIHAAAVAVIVREHRSTANLAGLRAIPSVVRHVPAGIAETARFVVRRPGLRRLVSVELLWGAGLVAVEALWQPRTAQLLGGATDDIAIFGLLGAGVWVACAVGAAIIGRVVRPGRSSEVASFAMKIGQAATLLGMAAASGLVAFAPAFLMFYVVHGAANPVHQALLHRRAGSAGRATLLSINSLCSMTGGFVANLALPALAGVSGVPVAWVVAAALLAVSAPLYLSPRSDPGDGQRRPDADRLRTLKTAEA